MDSLVDVDELLKDESSEVFCSETEQLETDVQEIFKQWKICGTFPSNSHSNSSPATATINNESRGLKYIDTRTFTRPKKKYEHSFSNMSNLADESIPGEQTPAVNLQIGGLVTPAHNNMQKSWLNDVSPPGSIMSSMDFSINERMGNSLITSGDFTNVSYLLNNNAEEMDPNSNFQGYGLSDVIKDRKFLENLSFFDDNTLTKDCNISRTDLNGIDENFSGCTTMQNSIESIPKSNNKLSFDETLEQLSLDPNLVALHSTFDAKSEVVMNGTYNAMNGTCNLNGTFTRKPKSRLNDTYEAMKLNLTFDATAEKQTENLIMNTTTVLDKYAVNDTFALNKTAVVNGETKKINQTYNYELVANESSNALQDETFDQDCTITHTSQVIVEDLEGAVNEFSVNLDKTLENGLNGLNKIQSTPFHKQSIELTHHNSQLDFEVNVSPILPRTSKTYLNRTSTMETDDFDVEIRRISSSPKKNNERNGPQIFEGEKRVSLQTFEAFEKSILECQSNEVEFDEMLNSFASDMKMATESEKMRVSLDNIKKRHSLINLEKQQEEIRRRETNEFHMDNKLMESMNKSMSSSSGSERLLNRRSRLNDDIHLTLSPQKDNEVDLENQNGIENELAPAPVHVQEAESSDRKNRDRFKTIRITKRREDGVGYMAPEIEVEGDNVQMFNKIDYNSPKAEPEVFKVPQAIAKPESKLRSLSKPRMYGTLNKKDLSLQLSVKSSSSDNLENNRPDQYSQQNQQRIPSKLSISSSNLKSPMGTKSKSYHSLVFNQNNNGSNSNLNKIPSKIGTSVSKLSHNASNSELQSNASKIQSNLRIPRASSLVRPGSSNRSIPDAIDRDNTNINQTKLTSQLSSLNLRAPNATKRMGLVRPSSGYFSYNTSKRNDSDNESVNSLSSSSASSRGSLYRVDSQTINNVQIENGIANSIEDISVGNMTVTSNHSNNTSNVTRPSAMPRPSGLKPPSSLRPPSSRSGLPRPTSYVRR